MRRYDEPIAVAADPEGTPLTFVWRGRSYAVHAVHARWRERRSWWDDTLLDPAGAHGPGGDTECSLWQVEAGPSRARGLAGIYDLGSDGPGGPWRLVRSHD